MLEDGDRTYIFNTVPDTYYQSRPTEKNDCNCSGTIVISDSSENEYIANLRDFSDDKTTASKRKAKTTGRCTDAR